LRSDAGLAAGVPLSKCVSSIKPFRQRGSMVQDRKMRRASTPIENPARKVRSEREKQTKSDAGCRMVSPRVGAIIEGVIG
jgi:hypothetical protein